MLAVFVLFTRPDGGDVYVNPEAVAAILGQSSDCATLYKSVQATAIRTVDGRLFCVAESPADVVNRLDPQEARNDGR